MDINSVVSKKNIRRLRKVVKLAAQGSSIGHPIPYQRVLNNFSNPVAPESEVDKFQTKLHDTTRVDPTKASLKGIKLSYLYDALTNIDRFDVLKEKTLDEFVKTYLNGLLKD
eukprot:gene38682-52262_t